MEKPKVYVGLGATVQVNLETPLFRFLLHDLRMRSIAPIDPSDAHITLVHSSDTSFRINSAKDIEAVEQAKFKATTFLGLIAFEGWELFPIKPEVTKLENSKRRVGIYVDDSAGELKEVRDELLQVFAESSNGKVCLRKQRTFEPHLTLGTRTSDYYKEGRAFSPDQRKKIKVPESFVMTDVFEVSDKTIEVEQGEAPEPQCDDLRYRNVPPNIRRAM